MSSFFRSFDTLPAECQKQILLCSASMANFYAKSTEKRHGALGQLSAGQKTMRQYLTKS